MNAPHGPRLRALTAIVVLSLWGLATHGTHAGSGDEPHYLVIAHSLAFDGDLDLTNNYAAAEPLIAGGTLEPGAHARPGRDGRIRPVHDVGLPLLVAPYVRIARPLVEPLLARPDHPVLKRLRLSPSTAYRHLLSALMIVVAALLARLLCTTLIAAGATVPAAFWSTLVVALSPPLLIFSILLFTELTSALLCLHAFRRTTVDPAGRTATWMLTGIAVGLLPLVHIRNIGLVVPLVVLGGIELIRQGSRERTIAFLAPLAILAGVRTAVTYGFWGTYLMSPHARSGGWPGWSETISIAGTRIGGLLLDQEFGLLPYAPVFILAVVGVFRLWRTQRTLLVQLSAVAGCYMLLVCLPSSNAHGWTGGWSPPARFLVPIIPLAAIPLWRGLIGTPRGLLVPILIVQVTISAYVWQHPKSLWNDGDGVAEVCEQHTSAACRFLPAFPPGR